MTNFEYLTFIYIRISLLVQKSENKLKIHRLSLLMNQSVYTDNEKDL